MTFDIAKDLLFHLLGYLEILEQAVTSAELVCFALLACKQTNNDSTKGVQITPGQAIGIFA